MRIVLVTFLVAAAAVVNSHHTFVGTNVQRTMVYHNTAEYGSYFLQKRVENLFFSLPALPQYAGKCIQGIMAFDLKKSEASANITQGGIGHNFVDLRMKSERGLGLNYDIYIYV